MSNVEVHTVSEGGRPAPPEIINVSDYQAIARQTLPKPLYQYLASGTDDEQTLSENESAFKGWYLRPRTMRPVDKITTSTTLFGQRMDLPVFISPAGVHALCETEHGECASARAAGEAGTIFGLSQHSTRSIEQVAKEAPDTNLWYQAYILKDRDMTLKLVKRAKEAGYKGIFLTVDSVRFGFREADARNAWNALPSPHRLVNYDDVKGKGQWMAPETHNARASSLEDTYNAGKEDAWDQNVEQMFEQNPTWSDVKWLKTEACLGLPLVVKGIMTGEDARLAVEHGADGVMVSNHGGRGLDGALPAIDALPEIANAVGGRVPVLLDSGVRRGTDVVKALALGATAVGIGKPVFFALATDGEKGVFTVLQILQRETEAAMCICGCESVEKITRELVCRHPSGGSIVRYVRSML
mmetsp:Transcript_14091/g.30612  ORF Transcript_14091/g.30612 Transcript_14091/m.30612 type:complete len:412 (-) Transcript_14091:34-1269(-)